MHNNFLMGVKFWTSWKNFQEFSKTPSWREFLKNILKSVILKIFWRPPTCLKFNTHKKFVAHFFIPMLLLPLTLPLIYLKIKKFKGPKVDHFTLSQVNLFFRKRTDTRLFRRTLVNL